MQISRQKRQLDRRKRYEQSIIQTNQKQALLPEKQAYDELVNKLNNKREALTQYLSAVKKLSSNSLDNYKLANNQKQVYIKSDGGNYICLSANTGGDKFYSSDEVYQNNGKYYTSADYAEHTGIPTENLVKKSDGSVQHYQLAFDLSKYEDVLAECGLNTDLESVAESEDISSLESTINSLQSQVQIDLSQAYTNYTGEVDAKKTIYENELEMLEEEVADEETELELEQNDIETQMEYVSQELQAMGQAVSQEIQQNVIQLK